MRTWQLYVDESGDFASATRDLVVAGVLVEGYATPQLDGALKRRLDAIFVGVPYPAHAAHHNVRSSLLWGPLRGVAVEGPGAQRFLGATAPGARVVRDGHAAEVVAFRAAVESAATPKGIPYAVLTRFDRWLAREHPWPHTLLLQEAHRQRADLATFLHRDFPAAFPQRATMVVAAWQARGLADDGPGQGSPGRQSASDAAGDLRYLALYEALVERAVAFVAERDAASQLWIHMAGRSQLDRDQVRLLNAAEMNALRHPLLARAASPPRVVRTQPRFYDENVPPGIVLADFTANTLGRSSRQPSSWLQLATSVQQGVGIAPFGRSGLFAAESQLPAVQANGQARTAVRLACEGKPASVPQQPLWAREQATAWISAIEAEARP